MALVLMVKAADEVGVMATVLVILLPPLLEDPTETLVVVIDVLVVSLIIAVGTNDVFVVAVTGLDANLEIS